MPQAEELGAAAAIVVGAGALGSPAATALVAAGVGRVGVVDRGEVGPDDPGREALQWAPDVGRNRAESACAKLALMTATARAEPYPVELDEANARAIVAGADVVLDCSGSATTRLLVNDACCSEAVPLVVGAVDGHGGLLLGVRPGRSACWRCLHPEAADDAAGSSGDGATPGAVAGVLGSIQALSAVGLLAGGDDPTAGAIVRVDAGGMTVSRRPVERRPDCRACAEPAASRQSR